MFSSLGAGNDARTVLAAIDKSLAIIEFDLEGNILSANANFCTAMGYAASEIVGKHHSLFVEPAYAQSAEYRAFWAKLARGEFDAREYRRFGKGGREIWIHASYNPIVGRNFSHPDNSAACLKQRVACRTCLRLPRVFQ